VTEADSSHVLTGDVTGQVARALAEDLGNGDLTAALVPSDASVRARVIVRDAAILCGTAWFDEVFRQLDSAVRVQWHAQDSEALAVDQVVCHLEGPARPLLSGERTALNFLQTLSGTASVAARFVAAVADSGTVILDTRKTLPGLRLAQKYAVRCGGASNHRLGLFDAVLIKENHIRAAGSLGAAYRAATQQVGADILVEVEVEDLEQLDQALAAGAQRILLDNFDHEMLTQAVQRNAKRAQLEASGGVSLQNAASIAATGVDFISAGELTKDVQAVDYSMLFEID